MTDMKQKIVLSTNHNHGWASEFPREYQEFFLMYPDIIRYVENKEWTRLATMVKGYWDVVRETDKQYRDYPACIDAIPDLVIHELDRGAKFILNEVPYEHIVLVNEHNVITARY